MKATRVMAFAGLLALLVPCTRALAAASTASPQVQPRIAEVVGAIADADRGGHGAEIAAMADGLMQITDGNREALLLELARFIAANPGNEPVMGAALLIDYYGFTDEEKIGALAPQAGTDDSRLREVIWDVLGTVERPQGAQESVRSLQELERLLQPKGSDPPSEPESVRTEIDELSRDEIWWIRLYTAHLVRAHPDLAPDVLERLRADPDPRVRRAAGG